MLLLYFVMIFVLKTNIGYIFHQLVSCIHQYRCLGITENHGKMAEIMTEICNDCTIHGKITTATIKSEHGSESHIVNI